MVAITTRLKPLRGSGGKNQLLDRLKKCRDTGDNRKCADCGDKNPAWASIVTAPGGSSKKFGVFCCFRCCSYHFQLGKDVCQVRTIKTADVWTDEEIQVMESSGNKITNAIYEGVLPKEFQRPGSEDHEAQANFVAQKYDKLDFFCKKAYYETHNSLSSSSNHDKKETKRRSFQEMLLAEMEEDISMTENETDMSSSEFAAKSPSKSYLGAMEVDLGYEDQDELLPQYEKAEIDLGYSKVDLGYGDTNDCLGQKCVAPPNRSRRGRRSSMNDMREPASESSTPTTTTAAPNRSRRGRRSSMSAAVEPQEAVNMNPSPASKSRRGRRSSTSAAGSQGAVPTCHENLDQSPVQAQSKSRRGRRSSMSAAAEPQEALPTCQGNLDESPTPAQSRSRRGRRSSMSAAEPQEAGSGSGFDDTPIPAASTRSRRGRRSSMSGPVPPPATGDKGTAPLILQGRRMGRRSSLGQPTVSTRVAPPPRRMKSFDNAFVPTSLSHSTRRAGRRPSISGLMKPSEHHPSTPLSSHSRRGTRRSSMSGAPPSCERNLDYDDNNSCGLRVRQNVSGRRGSLNAATTTLSSAHGGSIENRRFQRQRRRASTCGGGCSDEGIECSHSGIISSDIEHQRSCRRSFRRSMSNCSAA